MPLAGPLCLLPAGISKPMPLMIALKESIDLVELLLRNNAHAGYMNIANNTVYDIALKNGSIMTANLIRRYMSKNAGLMLHGEEGLIPGIFPGNDLFATITFIII
ncbi:MAG: hypothetical protein JW969_14985 [Spirochaetales bacterium]|nr:hypothetical protein [Spirochaetales bacterium]